MKVALTIAGSDSIGGAGIQADLKTFEAFGVFGTSALTVLTAQNTTGVREIFEVSPSFVQAQIRAVLEDFEVDAVKIGMLYSTQIIRAVKESIKDLDIPIVLDPVFISKAGSPLLQPDAIEAMQELFPYVSVITPNLYEAKGLFGYEEGDSASLEKLMACGAPVVVKNHILDMPQGKKSLDLLYANGRKSVFALPALQSANLHGTGCSFASAIAANLALAEPLERAIEIAKKFVHEAILHAPNLGHGAGVINHKEGVKHV